MPCAARQPSRGSRERRDHGGYSCGHGSPAPGGVGCRRPGGVQSGFQRSLRLLSLLQNRLGHRYYELQDTRPSLTASDDHSSLQLLARLAASSALKLPRRLPRRHCPPPPPVCVPFTFDDLKARRCLQLDL